MSHKIIFEKMPQVCDDALAIERHRHPHRHRHRHTHRQIQIQIQTQTHTHTHTQRWLAVHLQVLAMRSALDALYLSREHGELWTEESIFHLLIRLYRSPEALMVWTDESLLQEGTQAQT